MNEIKADWDAIIPLGWSQENYIKPARIVICRSQLANDQCWWVWPSCTIHIYIYTRPILDTSYIQSLLPEGLSQATSVAELQTTTTTHGYNRTNLNLTHWAEALNCDDFYGHKMGYSSTICGWILVHPKHKSYMSCHSWFKGCYHIVYNTHMLHGAGIFTYIETLKITQFCR